MDEDEQTFNNFQDDQDIESDNQKYPDIQNQINNNIDEEEVNDTSLKYPNINENFTIKNMKKSAYSLSNNQPFSFRNINIYTDFDISNVVNNIKINLFI